MDDGTWARIRRLFEDLVERRPEDREAHLAAHCHDETVRREVSALLEVEALLDAKERQFSPTPPRRGEPSDADNSSDHPASSILKRLETTGKRYRVDNEIARGGMGVVLKVWDSALRRNLAMKVILGPEKDHAPKDTGTDDSLVVRFVDEAQITGQLDHPGVVPIHELGLDEKGRPFFTMQLVKGMTFLDIVHLVHEKDEEWTQTRALGVLLRVAEALAYAHTKRVIHRDIKPANIMVGRFGEVYIMDWGLARILDEDERRDLRIDESRFPETQLLTDRQELAGESDESPLLTMDGHVIGTPAYMPPEQAEGRMSELNESADIYSLGAVLYHLLARRPYSSDERELPVIAVLGLVLAGPPEPLQKLRPDTPPELISICEKAMARHARDRYAGMSELADDLRAFLENRVVIAHRTGALVELRKWVRRNRLAAAALCLVVLSVLGGSITVSQIDRRAAGRAQAAKNQIEAKNTELQAAYEEQYPEEAGEMEYRASHILVETEEEAQALVTELEDGGDFAALARENSTGPSASAGGDLGWFGEGDMVEPFFEAVAALETGGVSDPVQTQFGWHVITLAETREKERPAFDTVRDELENQVREQMLAAHVEKLSENAKIDRPDISNINPEAINDPSVLEN